jgi:hypothetical protein
LNGTSNAAPARTLWSLAGKCGAYCAEAIGANPDLNKVKTGRSLGGTPARAKEALGAQEITVRAAAGFKLN